MTAAALALVSALAFGFSDFAGGIASKERSLWMVVAWSQLTGALLLLVVALFSPGNPDGSDFAWGAAAGLGGVVGITFLYRGLAVARMGVVSPLSGIGSVLVPAAVGVATGEEPSTLAWVGIALVFPAIYLIPQSGEGDPRPGSGGSSGILYGAVAGLGFGGLFAALGQIGDDAGFLPLAWELFVVAGVVLALAVGLGRPWKPDEGGLTLVLGIGLLVAIAELSFLLATREGLLALVSVIAALYPGGTVVLAAVVLREHIGRLQAVGLGLAAIAVILVTVGSP